MLEWWGTSLILITKNSPLHAPLCLKQSLGLQYFHRISIEEYLVGLPYRNLFESLGPASLQENVNMAGTCQVRLIEDPPPNVDPILNQG